MSHRVTTIVYSVAISKLGLLLHLVIKVLLTFSFQVISNSIAGGDQCAHGFPICRQGIQGQSRSKHTGGHRKGYRQQFLGDTDAYPCSEAETRLTMTRFH